VEALMFAFGSAKWPGIAKLVEEAGEVAQVCGKLMMTLGEVMHWEGTDLKIRLEDEIADVMAACHFVLAYCDLDIARVTARTKEKVATFDRWHREARNA